MERRHAILTLHQRIFNINYNELFCESELYRTLAKLFIRNLIHKKPRGMGKYHSKDDIKIEKNRKTIPQKLRDLWKKGLHKRMDA